MMIAVLPLVVALVGVLMYALCTNLKLAEIGRLSFFVGLFWLVYGFIGKVLHVG